MSYGYDKQGRVFIGDTMTLQAEIFDDNEALIPQGDISSVTFTVLVPGDDPASPTINAQAGTITSDGTGFFLVSGSYTIYSGEYKAFAKFMYTDPVTTFVVSKTVLTSFEVIDPFVRTGTTPADPAVDLCWQKIEDCFDSEYGGPWLRDMTMANFSKDKVRDFVPDVLLEINAEMPQTEFTSTSFPWATDDGTSIFGLGLLVSTIRHLMRSYTEQPDQSSSPTPHLDRTRYQQAWASVYAIEKERYDHILPLFKVRSFAQNGAALLVASKQGRLLPAPLRTRNIGRGYY